MTSENIELSLRVTAEMRALTRQVLSPTPIREKSLGDSWLARVPWQKMGEQKISPDLLTIIDFFRSVEALVEPHYEDIVVAGTASRKSLTVEDIQFMNQAAEWGYQEKGHGEFLTGVLRNHADVFGETSIPTHAEATAALMNHRSFLQRHAPTLYAPIARIRPEDYRLIVSLTGLVTENLTWLGYNALREKADHPVLNFGLGHIMSDEKTHGEYYFQQAKSILEENPGKRKLARVFMQHFYKPVGVRELGADRFDYAINKLLGGARTEKFMEDRDTIFASLPGMQNLTPLTDTIRQSQKKFTQRMNANS